MIHSQLTGRSELNQHPIAAIDTLESQLASKASNQSVESIVSELNTVKNQPAGSIILSQGNGLPLTATDLESLTHVRYKGRFQTPSDLENDATDPELNDYADVISTGTQWSYNTSWIENYNQEPYFNGAFTSIADAIIFYPAPAAGDFVWITNTNTEWAFTYDSGDMTNVASYSWKNTGKSFGTTSKEPHWINLLIPMSSLDIETTIAAFSTNNKAAGAKAVYDYCTGIVGDITSVLDQINGESV
jgi:hypothetical protein